MKKDDQQIIDLLIRYRSNEDKAAYELFLHKVSSMIEGMVRQKVQDEFMRQDLKQEILISVHKSLHTFDMNRSFFNWFYSIVRFRTADFFRKHYRDRDLEPLNETLQSNFLDLEEQYFVQEVKEFIGELGEVQAEVIRRSKIQGEKIKDISRDLGISESSVKVNIFRGLKKLRKRLHEER